MNIRKQAETAKQSRLVLQGFTNMLAVMGGPPLVDKCNEMYATVNVADRDLVKGIAASAAQKVVETWALEKLHRIDETQKTKKKVPAELYEVTTMELRALAKEVVQAVYSIPVEGDLSKLVATYARDDEDESPTPSRT